MHEGRITLIPMRKMKTLHGVARGINTHVRRDADRV